MTPTEDLTRSPRIKKELEPLGYGSSGLSRENSPSWRGWIISLFSCAALGIIVPISDKWINSTQLSLNLLPSTSIVLTLFLMAFFNLGLARFRRALALRKQDLTLVFCTTMVVNALPSCGWMDYLTALQMGPYFYARPENRWEQTLLPLLPQGFSPIDPTDPNSTAPRPVEWFFTGLPNHTSIPWGLLAGPYIRWALMLPMVLGLFFAIGALLYKQWGINERLPFPLMQIPETMMTGSEPGSKDSSFLSNQTAWWGVGLAFALHSWNSMGDFIPNWAPIKLLYQETHKYMTEAPWKHLTPFYFNVYPAVIGICYLISLEVSFSLWFFFGILRIGILAAILGFGLGSNGWDFNTPQGPNSIFIGQGTGACLALVLASLYLARKPLWNSVLQAVGKMPLEPSQDLSPRAIWSMIVLCSGGMLAWLMYAGASWHWSILAIGLLMISATGVARLVAEAGVFLVQMQASPVDLIQSAFTPVTLGTKNFVVLSQWSRVFSFDWYRTCPFINIFGALHLGQVSGLKQRHLLWGLSGAVLVMLTTGFFGFYYTAYSMPGGARQYGWQMDAYPREQAAKWASTVTQVNTYEKVKLDPTTASKDPDSDAFEINHVDTHYLKWMGVGALVLLGFLFMRTRIFWWPHPIGYVMWMAERPLRQIWFSCLIGWLIKWAIVRWGGHKMFQSGRLFFTGLIVGEALAAVFWLVLKACYGITGGYAIEIN